MLSKHGLVECNAGTTSNQQVSDEKLSIPYSFSCIFTSLPSFWISKVAIFSPAEAQTLPFCERL